MNIDIYPKHTKYKRIEQESCLKCHRITKQNMTNRQGQIVKIIRTQCVCKKSIATK